MTSYSPATERAISSVQAALRKRHLSRDEAIEWLISAAADYSVLAGDFRRECPFTAIAWRTAELLAAIRDITRERDDMTVSAKARQLPGGAGELEDTARQLFGRGYRTLTDGEAEQVWDATAPDEAITYTNPDAVQIAEHSERDDMEAAAAAFRGDGYRVSDWWVTRQDTFAFMYERRQP